MLKIIYSHLKKLNLFQRLLLFYIATFIFHTAYGFYSNSFGQDVARDLVLMESHIQSGNWIVGYGPKASVGNFYLPPLYYQLHILLSLLTNNYPFVMKLFVILIESATPLLLLLIFRLLKFGRLSWFLALLYLVAPIPTLFGSFAWNPNTIPFFSTWALYCWLKIIESLVNRTPKSVLTWEPIAGVLAVVVAFHFHYQAAVVFPFAAVIVGWSFWLQPNARKYWLLGVLLSLLTIVPYFLEELKSHWSNTQAILSYFSQEHSQYYDRVSKPAYFLTFFPGFTERLLMGRNLPFLLLGRVVFFLGGLFLAFEAFTKRKTQPLHLWIGIYFLSIIMMLRSYKGDKLDYYLSTLYIFPILLLGYIAKKNKYIAAIMIIIMLVGMGIFYTTQKRVDGYKNLTVASQFIQSKLNNKAARYIFHNDDDINTFVYGLSKAAALNVDQSSLTVVEICEPLAVCIWDQVRQCAQSRGYTYSSIVKSTSGYTNKATLDVDGRTILVGQFDQTPNTLGYPLYLNDLSYGSDTLYPELYKF